MSAPQRMPVLARILTALMVRKRDDRDQVVTDLGELLAARTATRSAWYARRRLYRDIFSVWRMRPPSSLAADAVADLRHAARLFARRPAIFVLTIAGLALGLGISTAAFTIMNAAFLRGSGIEDSDRAPGILQATERGVSTVWKYEQFLRLREGSSLAHVEAALGDGASFRASPASVDDRPHRIAFVSGAFIRAMGGTPLLGRTLEPPDERYEGPLPMVVSYRTWVDQMNSDPAVIGRTFWLGRAEATLVGVMKRGFTAAPGNGTAFWVPLTAYGHIYGALPNERTPRMGVEVVARLRAGVTYAEAEAQLSGIADGLSPAGTPAHHRFRARLDPEFGAGRIKSSTTLTIAGFVSLMIALILVLALANVATVLIACAITRDREMGVRLAMGAGRGRILRQLMTEGVALGAISAALALAFTYWSVPVVAAMLEAPAGVDLHPDVNVLLFLAFAAVIVGGGAGLAPAWHARGTDLLTPLKGDGARTDRAARRRLRAALVFTQAAASVVLIVLATLLVRATWTAAQIDVGFDARGLHGATVSLGVSDESAERLRSYWTRALAELRATSEVQAVALVEFLPFGNASKTSQKPGGPRTYFNRTSPEYFQTMGLRLLAGRTYTHAETLSSARVAVISESLARAHWGDASPLGHSLKQVGASGKTTIIGVVADTITADLYRATPLAVYEPLDREAERFARLLVRTRESSGAMELLREKLQRIDGRADVRIASIEDALRLETSRPRTLAALASFVGAVAIVLCVIGIYGLTASIAGQRTREIGVRVALGAERRDVLRLLLLDSLRPVLAGLVLGTIAALFAGRVVAGLLLGVSPADPLALGAAAVLLVGSAGMAAFVPSRRAASVDPAFVLRQS